MKIDAGIILFDKSFLEMLNPYEAKAFESYCTLICDELRAEIQGDYAKEDSTRFYNVAKKLPNTAKTIHGSFYLCALELLGFEIPMTGDLPVLNEENVFQFNHLEVFQNMLMRWPKGEIYECEKEFSFIRRSIIEMFKQRLNLLIQDINKAGFTPRTCKTLEQARDLAESYLRNSGSELMNIAGNILNISSIPFAFDKQKNDCILALQDKNYERIIETAPYTAYILKTEVFFQIAIASKHFKIEGNSLTDLRYMHYLPFCKYFVSNDKLHSRLWPLFSRDYQIMLDSKAFKVKLSER